LSNRKTTRGSGGGRFDDPVRVPAAVVEVRAADAERVQHAQRVGGEVVARVGGLARRIRPGPAGVAVVVADDVPVMGGEPLAESGVPPVHRCGQTADQQQRRILRVSERLQAQLHAVGRHELLGHGGVTDRRRRTHR
jgi:hypothetical protein